MSAWCSLVTPGTELIVFYGLQKKPNTPVGTRKLYLAGCYLPGAFMESLDVTLLWVAFLGCRNIYSIWRWMAG
jgi:hypothetical protein